MPNSNGGAGGAWPLMTGNDYLPNHLANGIDYGSIHMWPDNWARTDKAFGQKWLQAHIDDTKYLGKPLVLEEFGKAVGGFLSLTSQQFFSQWTYCVSISNVTILLLGAFDMMCFYKQAQAQ